MCGIGLLLFPGLGLCAAITLGDTVVNMVPAGRAERGIVQIRQFQRFLDVHLKLMQRF